MTKSQLKIFSVFHKEAPVPQCDFIEPLQVGKSFTGIDLGFLTDDTGDNISQKNQHYSELTALYWIWKHLDQIDSTYIGLCHYRRYFTLSASKGIFNKTDKRPIYKENLNQQTVNLAGAEDLKAALLKQLQAGSVVMPSLLPLSIVDTKYKADIKSHYIWNHVREDWDLMEQTIKKLFPEYVSSWPAFESAEKMFCCNMFIADKAFINNYCTWLFAIEDKLEKIVKIIDYPYQRRIFGFFSERLINLYLWHNKIKTAEFPVLELA